MQSYMTNSKFKFPSNYIFGYDLTPDYNTLNNRNRANNNSSRNDNVLEEGAISWESALVLLLEDSNGVEGNAFYASNLSTGYLGSDMFKVSLVHTIV